MSGFLTNKMHFIDSSGGPLAGGKVYTYDAGTSNLKTTYTTSALSVAQTNPIILNSRGEPDNPVWCSGSTKLVVKDSADVTIYTFDNVKVISGFEESNDYTVTGNWTFTGTVTGALVADQSNASGAIPAVHISQDDVSEEIIEIVSTAGVGNAVELVGAKTLTTTMFIKCTINGSTVYIPAGTIA